MNVTTEDDSLRQNEVAEELHLQSLLKRQRLEEAAKSPDRSRLSGIYLLPGIVLVVVCRDQLADHFWMVILGILAQVAMHVSSIHRRIDAIQELAKLKETERG